MQNDTKLYIHLGKGTDWEGWYSVLDVKPHGDFSEVSVAFKAEAIVFRLKDPEFSESPPAAELK